MKVLWTKQHYTNTDKDYEAFKEIVNGSELLMGIDDQTAIVFYHVLANSAQSQGWTRNSQEATHIIEHQPTKRTVKGLQLKPTAHLLKLCSSYERSFDQFE